MDDQQLIAAIRGGEVERFRVLVEKYHRPLLTFIQTITRNHFLTEEIGQTVFLSFFQAIDTFDETRKTPVLAWLYTAGRNQAINVMKKEGRYITGTHLPDGEREHRSGPLDLLIEKLDRDTLDHCLAQLHEPHRSALRQSLEGYSIKEIAAKQLIPPGTVKSRLARAKSKLSTLLRVEMGR